LHGADIIALEELEGQRVLDDLLKLPAMKGYKSAFMPGNDGRGINVALLYREDTIQLNHLEQATPDAPDLPPSPGQIDPGKLFARPPLIADVTFRGAAQSAEGAQNLSIMVNHFKSKLGGDKAEVRRQAESAFVGGLVDARRAAHPSTPVIVLGDLNALPGEKPIDNLKQRPDGSERMVDLPDRLPKEDRYSEIYRGQGNLLDHMLVTPDLAARTKVVEIKHINSATDGHNRDPRTPNGMSDHDPLYASFDFSPKPAAHK
jgi:predicted extracellular nuclease